MDAHIGFLYKIAGAVSVNENNNNHLSTLKSYYLMRCKELTKGFGLPKKYFSKEARCPHCCIEWKKTTEVKVKKVKLTKSQRRKFKRLKKENNESRFVKRIESLLQGQHLEKVCSFCKHTTTCFNKQADNTELKDVNNENKTENNTKKYITDKKSQINVYAKSNEVFSMKNKNNIISKTIKDTKVIKNNKKKKVKFAGLCQQAVLASAKLKAEKESQKLESHNKLHLFLKPST